MMPPDANAPRPQPGLSAQIQVEVPKVPLPPGVEIGGSVGVEVGLPKRSSLETIPPPVPSQVGGEVVDVTGGGGEMQGTDNPSGKMEPCVCLYWVGPPTAKVGQAARYQIMVKNVSSLPVHQVMVRNKMPGGVTVNSSEPKPLVEGNMMSWDIGTLQPHEEKRIELNILPEAKGDIACQAAVSFTAMSTARLAVREPKLALKVSGPQQVLVGDPATVSVTVTNPGDGAAERVKVRAQLPPGLEHPRGKTVDFDLGNLAPNESRSIQLPCNTVAGGQQKVDVGAIAEGNLSVQESASIDVVMPNVDLVMTGRDMLYLDRKTTYTLKVTNPGSAPANNVMVSDLIPAGFKYLTASDQGQYDFATRTVSWYVGDLPAGQNKEIHLELQAIALGEHMQKASAAAARGLKADSQILTRIEGVSALLMEVTDLDNPVEVNTDTAYEIRVVNTGTKMETQLQIVCTLPEKMEFRDARGPNGVKWNLAGRDVIFEPLPKLAPRADVIFRVNVRGTTPGDFRFRAQMKADGLSAPVTKEESTKVY
jgi:uncharacterized repeat protein (TIGR01451 family)